MSLDLGVLGGNRVEEKKGFLFGHIWDNWGETFVLKFQSGGRPSIASGGTPDHIIVHKQEQNKRNNCKVTAQAAVPARVSQIFVETWEPYNNLTRAVHKLYKNLQNMEIIEFGLQIEYTA
jgi:hypothetical protein